MSSNLRSGLSWSKLMMLLVNEMLDFVSLVFKNMAIFLSKKYEELYYCHLGTPVKMYKHLLTFCAEVT